MFLILSRGRSLRERLDKTIDRTPTKPPPAARGRKSSNSFSGTNPLDTPLTMSRREEDKLMLSEGEHLRDERRRNWAEVLGVK